VKYQVIGLMSGTSLDGLDIACCEFTTDGIRWEYRILCAETVSYAPDWKEVLSGIEKRSALDFVTADVDFGHFSGRHAREFIQRNNLVPDFIASHGHTIFHQPNRKITSQIGRGAAIAAETGLRVVSDFRTLDVALGGQGAPLVPVGDMLLFSAYDFCLNIGGFANISAQQGENRIAFDICPANIVMNNLARTAGCEYDRDGLLAAGGSVNPNLLETLNKLPYFQQPSPKSLGKEWVLREVNPILDLSALPVNDQLATFCEHIAMQVAAVTSANSDAKMLITGGGAFNTFLISRIVHHARPAIILPDNHTINFKEALIFAFLGVLRWRNEINCLQSVTGASKDSSGGCIY
jgi:anhydro-N-acetylmuramic acid kinase